MRRLLFSHAGKTDEKGQFVLLLHQQRLKRCPLWSSPPKSRYSLIPFVFVPKLMTRALKDEWLKIVFALLVFITDNICTRWLNMIVQYSCVYLQEYCTIIKKKKKKSALRFDVCDVRMFVGTQHSEQLALQRQSARIDCEPPFKTSRKDSCQLCHFTFW